MRDASDGVLVGFIAESSSLAREAEAELCRRYVERARLYGLRHLRDADRARDLAQAVLVALIEAARANRIEDRDRVDRFVLGICRNQALRQHEAAARARSLAEEVQQVAVAATAPPASWDSGALFGCIGRLAHRAQQVVLLSFMEGHTADEIGEKLSLEAGNVRVIRHRAIAALRDCLRGGEGALA